MKALSIMYMTVLVKLKNLWDIVIFVKKFHKIYGFSILILSEIKKLNDYILSFINLYQILGNVSWIIIKKQFEKTYQAFYNLFFLI